MATHPLSGAYAPVLTPFKRDLSIDKAAHLKFCKWLLGNNTGLAILGTNSEANSLSLGERIELIENVVANGIPPDRLMPGTGTCAFPETIALTRASLDVGAPAVLMLPPFYYKNVSEDGLFAYYSEVIERIGDRRLKMCLYHIPKFSGVPISLPLIARLMTRYPGVIAGLKDSDGQMSYTLSLMKEFPTLRVFCASESLLLQTMQNGGAGCISACANINPAAIARLCAEWNTPEAEALQNALNPVRRLIESRPMIAALKATVAELGHFPSFAAVRPPLVSFDHDASAALSAALATTGFAMRALDEALH